MILPELAAHVLAVIVIAGGFFYLGYTAGKTSPRVKWHKDGYSE